MVSLMALGVSGVDSQGAAAGLFAGLGILVIIGGIILWILPIVIAGMRGHPNFWPILLIDVLLGWLFVGWVIALVWSVMAIPASEGAASGARPAAGVRSQALAKATAMSRSGKRIVIRR